MITEEITQQDILSLKRSWGNNWRTRTSGKSNAVKAANILLSKMKGKGWVASISENLGCWFYSVHNGPLGVTESDGKYSCLLSSNPREFGTGESFWYNKKWYGDPNEAVEEQMRIAQKFVDKCQKAIDTVKINLGEQRHLPTKMDK